MKFYYRDSTHLQVVNPENKRVLLYVLQRGQPFLVFPRQHEHLFAAFDEMFDNFGQLQRETYKTIKLCNKRNIYSLYTVT